MWLKRHPFAGRALTEGRGSSFGFFAGRGEEYDVVIIGGRDRGLNDPQGTFR